MWKCVILCLILCDQAFTRETKQNEINETDAKTLNERPIIGILAQEISYHLNTKWPGVYKSYIAASYVKWIESAGARPVPIWIGKDRDYYKTMMQKVNGMLYPGGATWFNQTNGYADAGAHVFEIAKEMNENGTYFPLFGTCLGFELLVYLSINRTNCLVNCQSQRQSLPLEFTKDYLESRMFSSAPTDVIEIMRNEPVTANFHQFCLVESKFKECHLDDQWRFMSYGYDINRVKFISTIEHIRYPFFGVQFHPEKSVYEWIRNRNISHTENAIKMSQFFASFFVHNSRLSSNQFSGVDEENRMLIYNYPVTFTALVKSAFQQSYLFDDRVDYINESSNGGKQCMTSSFHFNLFFYLFILVSVLRLSGTVQCMR